jgi:hypothetical protein
LTSTGELPTPRRTRAELRRLLVSAGTEILLEEGLGTGAEHLTFKRVFERIEVTSGARLTNASVIGRVFENQSQFQSEVLTTIARVDGAAKVDDILSASQPVFKELDLSSGESRWTTLRELCRLGAAAHLESVTGSRTWPRWVGVWALVMAGPVDERERSIEQALLAGYVESTSKYERLQQSMLSHFGFRVKEPFSLIQMTTAAGALAEGCALRARADVNSLQRILRPTGPHGEEQEWTLFGVGLLALHRHFLELDPEWVPPHTSGQMDPDG